MKNNILPLLGMLTGGGGEYAEKVLGLGAIVYWPLWDASGSTADNYEGTAARDGTYNGGFTLGQTGIGDGRTSVLLDGSTGYVGAYSTSFRDALLAPQEVSVCAWVKMANSGVWSDGAYRGIFRADSASAILMLRKKNATNTLQCMYGPSFKSIDSTFSGTGWFHYAFTASLAADELKAFVNGSQSGSTVTAIGTWNPAHLITNGFIGSSSTSAEFHSGWLAHVCVFNRALTPTEIGVLAAL